MMCRFPAYGKNFVEKMDKNLFPYADYTKFLEQHLKIESY